MEESARTTCAVDQPVAELEAGVHGLGSFLPVVLPGAHANLGHLGAISKPDGS